MGKECTDIDAIGERCGKRREEDRGGWKLRLKDHVQTFTEINARLNGIEPTYVSYSIRSLDTR